MHENVQKIVTMELKRVCLPFKLLGQTGRDQTIACRDKEEQTQIKQTKWLQWQNVKTTFNFNEDATWNWRMREDQNALLTKEEQQTRACVKSLQNECREIE